MGRVGLCFIDNFTSFIGVAPITQYMHERNKNTNTQGSSPNVVKVISCLKALLLKETPSGSKFFPLKEASITKRDIIIKNYCLLQ